MRGPFGISFLANPTFERVVPLEIPRGYRDAAGETREVQLLRYEACRACKESGCRRCAFVGWSVETSRAAVAVPAGATTGTRIVVPGGSDLLLDGARDLVVEIVQPGPRAEQLAAESGDYEAKLVTAWQMDEALHRRTQRKLRVGIGIALSLVALGFVVHWLGKAPAGEACRSDAECRSDACLVLVAQNGTQRHVDRQVCSADCESDLDCPHDMRCAVPSRDLPSVGLHVETHREGRSCLPDGY